MFGVGSRNIEFSRWHLVYVLISMLLIPVILDSVYVILPVLSQDFAISSAKAVQMLGVLSIGICVGLIFAGVVADVLGRKIVLVIGMFITALFSIVAYNVSGFNVLLLCRFLQGIGGAMQIVCSRAIISDITSTTRKRVQFFSLGLFVTLVGALLAPLLSSFILFVFNWRMIFFVQFIISSFLTFLILFVPETLVKSPDVTFKRMIKNSVRLFNNCRYIGCLILSICAYWWIFSVIVSLPFILTLSGYTSGYIGMIFSINMGFGILGTLINIFILQSLQVGISFLTIVASIFLIGSTVFLLVAQLFGYSSLLLLLIVLFVTNIFVSFVVANSTGEAISCFSDKSGMASSLLGVVQFGSIPVVSFVMGRLVDLTSHFVTYTVLALLFMLLFASICMLWAQVALVDGR